MAKSRLGKARRGREWFSRQGKARHGWAGQCLFRLGEDQFIVARLGGARQGWVWQCVASQGSVYRGVVRQRAGGARRGWVWRGYARCG